MTIMLIKRGYQSLILFTLLCHLHGLWRIICSNDTPKRKWLRPKASLGLLAAKNAPNTLESSSVHLKLYDIAYKSVDKSSGSNASSKSINFHEFVHIANGSAFLATSSTRANLENLSIHIFGQNLSDCSTSYRYQQVPHAYCHTY
jgi:hypothetical protein